MIVDRVMQELIDDEGFVAYVYKDTLGYKTIGYGFKMPLSPYEIKISGYDGIKMSESGAKIILESRLNATIKELNLRLSWLNSAPQTVKEVLYNMAYQMGVEGVLKFKNTLKLLKDGEYKRASNAMLNSLWAKQTPNRAKRLADKIVGLEVK